MYQINRDYIKFGNARSGKKIARVRFLVAHDTGNPGSTARQNRTHFHNNQPSASAHTFIDDTEILEIVPLDEKAWHVMYNKTKDNEMFGDDANDCAIGVELCFGSNKNRTINFDEAYKRYVWYFAYLCQTYGLDPRKHIVGHETLDPGRKVDPSFGLRAGGKTYAQFIDDVATTMNCANKPQAASGVEGIGVVTFTTDWGVNGYDAPNGSYKCKFHGGSFVAYDYRDGFYSLGDDVWVSEQYLTFKRHIVEVVQKGGVNVYSEPSKNHYKDRIQGPAAYLYYGKKDGFVAIGGNAWIPEEYVRIKQQ